MKTFGEKLKELRLKQGIGFNEFWREAKISKVYLSAIENGDQVPPAERQMLFLKVLESRGELSNKDKFDYFDLAATVRGEMPADIMQFYSNNKNISTKFREIIKGECENGQKRVF